MNTESEKCITCPECGGIGGSHANYRCSLMTLEYAQNTIIEKDQHRIKTLSYAWAKYQSTLKRLQNLVTFYQGKYIALKHENNQLRKQIANKKTH
jgi:hypothetical protein